MSRLIPLIPDCARAPRARPRPALPLGSLAHPFAQTDPETHLEIPYLSCSFIQTRRSFLGQEFSPLQALFPTHFTAACPNPARNAILAASATAVPGIKHDICVFWGNKGSVWAEPRAQGIPFHTAFCPQPCPSPPPAHQPCQHVEGMMPGSRAQHEES